MGRYYSGDIEGKFWFGVQNSNDASFFGGEESEPNYINYYFCESDKEKIKKGVNKCKKVLGDKKDILDKFFSNEGLQGYNDEMLAPLLNIKIPEGEWSHPEIKNILEWYARLELGEKILKCVEKNGECSFEAEL